MNYQCDQATHQFDKFGYYLLPQCTDSNGIFTPIQRSIMKYLLGSKSELAKAMNKTNDLF